MSNVDYGILQSINNMMVLEGFTLEEVSKKFKMKKGEIINIFKREGFIFDSVEGYFIKEETLTKRIEKIEKKQKEQEEIILELLSNTKQKNELKIDNDILNGKIIGRSFKLYENTSKKFTEFCKNHPELKMQEIITVALEKYMEDNK
ncbi:hypothetical protein ACY0I0_15550 [Clostridium perfringens]|uniref:hypothetical protein n=1 Tax=Clostridium perfringens TaxID=1502 RepID=UPI001A20B71B|nr:hypothetical protein [Clostridium perfringens]MBO3421338.1 hypothetical protein [Clostridium perfringens]MBO3427746.1 hypothetical protein [Clostridium perfringens]HAT4321918.1 hypothetical protein [Clostridium perfringens]